MTYQAAGTGTADRDVWTFARFEAGQDFGTVEVEMDAERHASWERIFGPTGDRLPRGMLVTAMMEAYIRAIQPRPDGNIHASQELDFREGAVVWGDTVAIEVNCAGKEERNGRFWVRFGIVARTAGRVIMTGTIRSIWAA
ncbi:hypothetical protein [Chachezhania sediminis]|uniref:hypothetical protein n=1 Tax=Chachezhania sediminis TaxID=2599291 RepID=UPI00131A72D3|nr:hypothetical protein [Chachezhania sediminis]